MLNCLSLLVKTDALLDDNVSTCTYMVVLEDLEVYMCTWSFVNECCVYLLLRASVSKPEITLPAKEERSGGERGRGYRDLLIVGGIKFSSMTSAWLSTFGGYPCGL